MRVCVFGFFELLLGTTFKDPTPFQVCEELTLQLHRIAASGHVPLELLYASSQDREAYIPSFPLKLAVCLKLGPREVAKSFETWDVSIWEFMAH